MVITLAVRVVLFSVVPVCVFVSLSVYLAVNMITPETVYKYIIAKFSGHYGREMETKFENGYY